MLLGSVDASYEPDVRVIVNVSFSPNVFCEIISIDKVTIYEIVLLVVGIILYK